jgi:hypothetical protein
LDCPRVVTLVGERIAAGMAKHMRVCLQLKAATCRCPFDQPTKASVVNGAPPLSLTKT